MGMDLNGDGRIPCLRGMVEDGINCRFRATLARCNLTGCIINDRRVRSYRNNSSLCIYGGNT